MKIRHFLQRTSNKEAENRLLKFAVVVLGICMVIGNFMSYRAVKSQRTIIVPPVINSKMTFTGYKASDEYVRELARYSIGLALYYNPLTARGNFGELLTLYAPEVFAAEKDRLYQLADRIESNRITSAFYIYDIKLTADKIELPGLIRQYQDKTVLMEELRTYIVRYRVVDGRFIIMGIDEKGGASA